jgi:hypothetical protein
LTLLVAGTPPEPTTQSFEPEDFPATAEKPAIGGLLRLRFPLTLAARAKSIQVEPRFRSKYLFGRMIFSEKSATPDQVRGRLFGIML